MGDKTLARKGICQGLATVVVLRSLDRCLSAGEKVINRSKPFYYQYTGISSILTSKFGLSRVIDISD